jgi:hypothetical protein
MDFSKSFFNKSIDDLDYQDIVGYFVELKEESTRVEFKAFSAQFGNFNKNLEGIIRAVCAFLNSEGGIVIWGAPQGVESTSHEGKVFQGSLSPVTDLKDKDWIINKVSDSITPLPVGVSVKIVSEEGKHLYIFEVQQSNYSPHQFKNCYWARLDGQTKPAPHYLIDSLFKKVSYPNIEGFIKLNKVSHNGTNYFLDISILLFNFSPLQNDESIVFRLTCGEAVFANAANPPNGLVYIMGGHQLVHKGLIDVIHFGSPSTHTEQIVIDPLVLSTKHQNKLNLLLAFGGKFSPMKFCSYVLDFGKMNWKQSDDPNYLISEMEENKLAIDKQNNLGTTRESLLEKILKR